MLINHRGAPYNIIHYNTSLTKGKDQVQCTLHSTMGEWAEIRGTKNYNCRALHDNIIRKT